ncbi:MAG: Uma2 family endonuclease, partial [Gemmatimonadetes bacterium]|nr:Uma2 family endonuclease [Gemmatimonadota bacterium]
MPHTLDSPARLVTAEELLRMPDDGIRRELVRGELRTMPPAGRRHGKVAMRIGVRLGNFVEEHGLGEVYAAETGFKLESDPDTVRAP